MRKKTEKSIGQSEAASLRKLLPPGSTVYTVLRHVSSSGMSRTVSLFIVHKKDDTIWPISWSASKAAAFILDAKENGIRVQGCGMDMGFHLVYELSRSLYEGGFGIEGVKGSKRKRPKSKKQAQAMVLEGYMFPGRNGDPTGWDPDGGYALKQVWL